MVTRRSNRTRSTPKARTPAPRVQIAAAPRPNSQPARERLELKPAAEPSRDQIAREAYFLWLRRGGNEVVNWLEAESQLKRQVAKR